MCASGSCIRVQVAQLGPAAEHALWDRASQLIVCHVAAAHSRMSAAATRSLALAARHVQHQEPRQVTQRCWQRAGQLIVIRHKVLQLCEVAECDRYGAVELVVPQVQILEAEEVAERCWNRASQQVGFELPARGVAMAACETSRPPPQQGLRTSIRGPAALRWSQGWSHSGCCCPCCCSDRHRASERHRETQHCCCTTYMLTTEPDSLQYTPYHRLSHGSPTSQFCE